MVLETIFVREEEGNESFYRRSNSRLVQGAVGKEEQTRVVELNGLFALITERANAPEGVAPKRASLIELDDDGLIRRMYFVLASRKLTALPGLTK